MGSILVACVLFNGEKEEKKMQGMCQERAPLRKINVDTLVSQ